MPSEAVKQALTCLVPSYPAVNKPFPPALVSQCESLLALSRQRAGNLRPEEEIARAHACSEIACDRLRVQLRLPTIKNGAGAPCKPRVYTKLLKFLDGVLRDASSSTSTPQANKKRDASGALKNTPASARKSTVDETTAGTPTKKRVTRVVPESGFVGKIKKNRKAKAGEKDENERAPELVMPSIRKLCKAFSTPTIAPHVYTGTCVVLGLSGLWSDDVDIDDRLKNKILTLVTSLYLMVLTRMQEGKMTTELYTDVLDKSAEVLDLEDDSTEKVETWINNVNAEGWCEGQDWWETVPEGVLVFGLEAEQEEDEAFDAARAREGINQIERSAMREKDPDGVLLPGLGTMLHAGIDWTSEDRRLDFEEWRTDLAKRHKTLGGVSPRKSIGRAVTAS